MKWQRREQACKRPRNNASEQTINIPYLGPHSFHWNSVEGEAKGREDYSQMRADKPHGARGLLSQTSPLMWGPRPSPSEDGPQLVEGWSD